MFKLNKVKAADSGKVGKGAGCGIVSVHEL